MTFFTLDYVINKILNQSQNKEQDFLKEITKINFSKQESKNIFNKIVDHKWYVSERLGRDVGLKVAAIDYFENIDGEKVKNVQYKNRKTTNIYETLSLV